MSSSANVPCSKIESWSNDELTMWSCIEKHNDVLEVRYRVTVFHMDYAHVYVYGFACVRRYMCIYVRVYHWVCMISYEDCEFHYKQ
jgi:hypothetical protein